MILISNQLNIRSAEIDLDLVNSLEVMIFGRARATKSKLEQIQKQQALLLVAYDEQIPVGFKLGYVVPRQQAFFSWMGGVHPLYRRRGIAQSLLDQQETHARMSGLKKIYFTTFDRFQSMIKLGRKNKYVLAKTEMDGSELKYWYEKQLG